MVTIGVILLACTGVYLLGLMVASLLCPGSVAERIVFYGAVVTAAIAIIIGLIGGLIYACLRGLP